MRVNTNVFALLVMLIIATGLCGITIAERVELFTDICPYVFDNNDPNLPIDNPYQDSNWDYYQKGDPNVPQNDPNTVEDAIYHCPFDGGSGHKVGEPPPDVVDGNVDGTYTTMSGMQGGSQAFSATGCDIEPHDERDDRTIALFNLSKVKEINNNAGAILQAKFRLSIDRIVDWTRNDNHLLPAPSTLYVSIYPASEQNYWCDSPPPEYPNTDINDLQDEFDGDASTEKDVNIMVWDGPHGSGVLQPLTDYYIDDLNYGAQFHELDFTEELRRIVSDDPNLEWVGFTIRASMDGGVVAVSLDALEYLYWKPVPKPIPPTLDVQVSEYLGDLDDDGDVDFVDFALFAQQWCQSGESLTADLNVDGTVDIADLGVLAGNWLKGK